MKKGNIWNIFILCISVIRRNMWPLLSSNLNCDLVRKKITRACLRTVESSLPKWWNINYTVLYRKRKVLRTGVVLYQWQ